MIKLLTLKKGEIIQRSGRNVSELLFIKQGKFTISIDNYSDRIVNSEQVILIPSNSTFKAEGFEDTYGLILGFQTQVQLCESYSLTQLYPYFEEIETPDFCILEFNDPISRYVTLLDQCIKDGIHCCHLYEMKKQEIFLLLRAYYPKELLASFLAPILDKEDLHFKTFVLDNCLQVKNVQELASMANYSTSGFIKKFTRCFNDSPHRWISQYKAKRILHEINSQEKSFKEISTEYNFSSMPHFIEFCKKQYGVTPGKMRRKKEQEQD